MNTLKRVLENFPYTGDKVPNSPANNDIVIKGKEQTHDNNCES